MNSILIKKLTTSILMSGCSGSLKYQERLNSRLDGRCISNERVAIRKELVLIESLEEVYLLLINYLVFN